MRDTSLLLLGLLLLPGSAMAEDRHRGSEGRREAISQPRDPAQQALADQLAQVARAQREVASRQAAVARRLASAPPDLRPQLELEVKRLADDSAKLAKEQQSLSTELRAGSSSTPR